MTEPTLTDRIMAMSPEAREAALMVLDEISRPLSPRDIEHALRRVGVDRSRSTLFASSLKKLHIIAVVGPEQ
jgi:hypothetical protein